MKVGDMVWLQTLGNLARNGSKDYPGWIMKIGRKYLYVARTQNAPEYSWIQIDMEDFRDTSKIGGSSWQMYLSEQHFLDKQEQDKLYEKIKTAFGGYSYTRKEYPLDKLRRMAAILDE